jgi:hypothetical protein
MHRPALATSIFLVALFGTSSCFNDEAAKKQQQTGNDYSGDYRQQDTHQQDSHQNDSHVDDSAHDDMDTMHYCLEMFDMLTDATNGSCQSKSCCFCQCWNAGQHPAVDPFAAICDCVTDQVAEPPSPCEGADLTEAMACIADPVACLDSQSDFVNVYLCP